MRYILRYFTISLQKNCVLMSYRNLSYFQPLSALLIAGLLFSCSVKKKAMTGSRPETGTSTAGHASGAGKVKEPVKTGQSYSAYNLDVADYIKLYSGVAVKEMQDFGVPASVILAQGIHESGAGKSLLAQEANNHFGVKCTSEWKGKSFQMNDDAPNECFRKYASAEESFDDHMKFLQRKRYVSLFTLDKEDYKGWAYGLKRCGYATNPRYSEILISMIERYNLTRFDHTGVTDGPNLAKKTSGPKPMEASVAENTHQPVLASSVAAKNLTADLATNRPNSQRVIMDTIHRKIYITDTIYQYAYQKAHDAATGNRIEKPSVADSNTYQGNTPQKQVTDTPAVIPASAITRSAILNAGSTPDLQIPLTYTVKQGDTLYGIARRFKLKIDELQKLNNLPDTGVKIDQILHLQ